MATMQDHVKAVNMLLTRVALRANQVNSQYFNHDGGTGVAPPIRVLSLVFSDRVFRLNEEGWDKPLSGGPPGENFRYKEEKLQLEMLAKFNQAPGGGTNDFLALAHLLQVAFEPSKEVRNPENRVKIIVFVTDGDGAKEEMTEFIKYVNDPEKKGGFPPWLRERLMETESMEKANNEGDVKAISVDEIEKNLSMNKDQVFVLAVGLPYNESVLESLIDVYNQGKPPHEDPEDDLILLSDPRKLPDQAAKLVLDKFKSKKFNDYIGRTRQKRMAEIRRKVARR
jgi:hypothetical protein